MEVYKHILRCYPEVPARRKAAALSLNSNPPSSLHPASACKRLMFRHLIRRRFYHTWVGMLPPPYPHPELIHSSPVPECKMFATIRDRARPLQKPPQRMCSLNSLLNFRSRHNTDFASHVRINSGFSPLSTKHRALQHTRGRRFWDGLIASGFENGHFAAIVRRAFHLAGLHWKL